MNALVHFIKYVGKRITVSVKHMPITIEYPFVSKPIAPLTKARIKNVFSECIGCLECQSACPTEAISILAEPYGDGGRPLTSQGIPFQRSIESFKIDYAHCVSCGLCVDSCPTQSLGFDRTFIGPQERSLDLVVDLVHLPRSMRRGDVP